MLFKSSKFYSFITDIPESIFRTPTFKIYYKLHCDLDLGDMTLGQGHDTPLDRF